MRSSPPAAEGSTARALHCAQQYTCPAHRRKQAHKRTDKARTNTRNARLLHVAAVGLGWREHDAAVDGAAHQVAPARVRREAGDVADDEQRAAAAREPHVDAPLVSHKADGAAVHAGRAHAAEQHHVLLAALPGQRAGARACVVGQRQACCWQGAPANDASFPHQRPRTAAALASMCQHLPPPTPGIRRWC